MSSIRRFLFYRADIMVQALDIMVRLYLLKVFFQSGLTKLQSWQSTLSLFEYEYNVPLLSPQLAAIMATAGELILPVLILFGLMTRPAAMGLFVLNAVAAYAYASTDYYNMTGMLDHILWGLMALVYVFYGPGPLTIDNFLAKRFNTDRH